MESPTSKTSPRAPPPPSFSRPATTRAKFIALFSCVFSLESAVSKLRQWLELRLYVALELEKGVVRFSLSFGSSLPPRYFRT
eukprot:444598-Amorphochlora_amoeboformis.AAC.1